MGLLVFAGRNRKEILRDPLNLAFSLGFPIILLLLSAIQSNIPISLFEIVNLAPGVAVFGLSFISLFSGMLIAKDRGSSFFNPFIRIASKSSRFYWRLRLTLNTYRYYSKCHLLYGLIIFRFESFYKHFMGHNCSSTLSFSFHCYWTIGRKHF